MARTAQQVYSERFAHCHELLEAIDAGLRAHTDRQATEPRSWAYTGDLAHVQELLAQAAITLGAIDEDTAERRYRLAV